ncbi:MAG: hypothetical protein U9N07_06815 [Euryarchaeota archaeon]|nr:hypothetical protein [Euryarchaeota archaeon]
MNWDAIREDPYYRAREIEHRARANGSADHWMDYAACKMKKGSYLLAIHGYMNAAHAYERNDAWDNAIECYDQAIGICKQVGYIEPMVLLTYRLSYIYEHCGDLDNCIAQYDRLGCFLEDINTFLAADAYEHAAEIMLKSGKDISNYNKPIDAWKKNARYWEERGELDDAEWSEERILLYKKLVRLI